MLSPDEKEKIRVAIERKARDLDERIEEYRELTKPIPPSEAIGRVSRMDAINNKSVNEAALRQAEKQRQGLDRALQRLDDEGLSDNTIVFLISDHGRAHIRDKQFLYDGDTWYHMTLRLVFIVGVSLCAPAAIMLFFFDDDTKTTFNPPPAVQDDDFVI